MYINQKCKPRAGNAFSDLRSAIFLGAFMFSSAFSYGQQKVTMNAKNSSLESVLEQLKLQTDIQFFYPPDYLKSANKVTLNLKEVSVADALKLIFKEQPFIFDFDPKDRTLLIKKQVKAQKSEKEQEFFIQGILKDDLTGNIIEGVSVVNKATSRPVAKTDADGMFIVKASKGDIFVMTHIGYDKKELTVRADDLNKLLTIKLSTKSTQLDGVIVTGIFKKEDKSFTGASTTITSEQLKLNGTRNLVTSLRNIEPSFNLIENNLFGSNPNKMPEIQIRGNSNIPNVMDLQNNARVDLNTPLIILDGFQTSLQKLLDINENDVHSITILKDAAATAMYGSRGANGVVVITTKMPAVGKLRVSFGSSLNIENPDLKGYNLLNARNKLELERLVGYYNSENVDMDYNLKSYYNYILNEVNRGVETNWLSIPLRTSVGQRHNLRIEGGENALRYSASLQYNNIAGVMKGSGRNTLNGGIMLSYNLKNVRFSNNTQITQGNSSNSPYGTFSEYVKMNSYWAPYDADGNVNKRLGDPGDLSYSEYWVKLPTNPLYDATLATYDKSEYQEVINNTAIEWRISPEILIRTQFGLTKQISQNDRFRPAEHTAFANYSVNDLFRKGDYLYGIGNNLNYDGSVNLSYNKEIGKGHNIYLAGDFNVRQNKRYDYSFMAEGFTNPRLDFLPAALQYAKGGAPTGTENFTRSVGFSGNASYNYNNRYFTDFVFRYDGASQFGSGQKFAPFWSYGLGWNIHEESFMKEIGFINRLKLRGSTGLVGSQAFSAYQALTTYRYYSGESYYNWNGAYILALGNDRLKWQQTQKNNLGADIELWNNKIKIRADIYRETTKDLVSSVNLPASNGFSSYVENLGKMENRGFETQLTFVLLNNTSNRLYWSVTGNILSNHNKILETSQALKDALKAVKNNKTDIGTIYEEGYSSNTIWVVPSMGIDPSNGKEVFRDRNGAPTYEWNGMDVVAAGSTEAKLFGNFSTLVRYKDFSINTVFRYTTGAQQYNNTYANRIEVSDYKYQMDKRVFENRWKYPGDQAAFKGLLVTSPTYKTSRFVQTERTLVLSNINLQYDLRDKPWMKRMGLQVLNITGNISEPMYLSTIKRERGTSYPFSRQFSIGFNAIF